MDIEMSKRMAMMGNQPEELLESDFRIEVLFRDEPQEMLESS